jgi:isocitrate lyase
LQAVENKWIEEAHLLRFGDAVAAQLKKQGKPATDIEHWLKEQSKLSHNDAIALAKTKFGVELFWDWSSPRTREGYFRYQGGIESCINRGIAFGPYGDLLWMETKKPVRVEAEQFAREVLAAHPGKLLTYNLSPSFNWDAAGMTDKEIETFVSYLGSLGYAWQFVTLGGFHSDALGVDLFARDFAKRGMLAYVERIQRQEREHGVETLQHQKWSGANYADELIKTVQGGIASTAAMGAGVTESQFGAKNGHANGSESPAKKARKH